MRKFVAIMLVLIMTLSFATMAVAEEKVELQFTLWGTNEGLSSVFDLVDQYNDSQDAIHVTVSGVESSVYFQKLNAFFSSNTAPDIIQVAADYGNEYTAKGVFAPLDDFLTDELAGTWAESLLDSLRTDDVLYAIPIGVQNSFIAYNKNLFDEAGLDYPTNDWTETELLDLAKQLTDSDKGQYGILVAGNVKEMVRDMYGDYCYDWDTNTMTAEGNESFKPRTSAAALRPASTPWRLFTTGISLPFPPPLATASIGISSNSPSTRNTVCVGPLRCMYRRCRSPSRASTRPKRLSSSSGGRPKPLRRPLWPTPSPCPSAFTPPMST